MLMRGELGKGVRSLESVIERAENEYGYRSYANWGRIYLAEFYCHANWDQEALAAGCAKKSALPHARQTDRCREGRRTAA